MTEFVVARPDGTAHRIELNRPETGNLVSMEMVSMLTDTVRRVPADASLMVLAGAGSRFRLPEMGEGLPPAL